MNDVLQCILCHEKFHCHSVKFCPALANFRTTNYVCTTLVNTHYVQFREYVWTKADAAAIQNKAVMQRLSNEFKWKQEHDVPKPINVEHKKHQWAHLRNYKTNKFSLYWNREQEV